MVREYDLVSLVLTVSPVETSGGPYWWGRAVYNLFMQLIDSQLATELHGMNTRKPFTCSTLRGPVKRDPRGSFVSPVETYWARITGFSGPVAAVLLAVEKRPPEYVELDRIKFRILNITSDSGQHPWAAKSSYAALYCQYREKENEQARQAAMDFVSPTAFHSNGKTVLFPTPALVFGGLLNTWNEYHQPLFPVEDVRALVEEHVGVSRYALSTRSFLAKAQHRELGFQGQITYQLMLPDSRIDWLFHLLAHYAFYAGVGYQTTTGLGQVRGQ